MSCEVGTIREIHRKLVSDGIHVSEYALRSWIKEGILPAVYSGNRAFITYANVRKILDGNDTKH